MFQWLRIVTIIVFTLLLTACGLTAPVKVVPQSTFALIGEPTSHLNPKSRHRAKLTLLVATPVASPGYGSTDMVYVKIPFRLRSYARNRWVAPPAQMILPILAQTLRKTGRFHAVVTPPYVGVTNYRLTTQLLILQQEFFLPISVVRLVMQATLMNSRTNAVVASKRFQVIVKAPNNNAYAGVLAANQAATTMSKRITHFVAHAI